MPRRTFDKKNATTFALVHRAQNDPLIHDDNASSMVFTEKGPTQRRHREGLDEDDLPHSSTASMMSGSSARSSKVRQRGDLEDEFGMSFQKNEGEAAQHGVFFDDTQYDYMQHMRDLGSGEGPATWIEATTARKSKNKGQRLEDALRDMDIGDTQSVGTSKTTDSVARSLLPDEVLPSEFVRKHNYQDQQDVPDAIAGFQPDMDPRLREVLEALEDEAYVDDEGDVFEELTQEGREVDQDEWERLGEQQAFDFGEDDDGWESDDTIKATSPIAKPVSLPFLPEGETLPPPTDPQAQPAADPTEGAWLDEFKKFKAEKKNGGKQGNQAELGAEAAPSALESSALSSLASGRRKKRKGAMTNSDNYSMTSSSLARTDQQTLLDARFDKMEALYEADELADEEEIDEDMSTASGMTGASKASRVSKYSAVSGLSGVSGISSYSRATDSEAPQLIRSDFDNMMDEFLGGYSKVGNAAAPKMRRMKPQSGMEQLDEIRKGLGPARVKSRAKAA
ncbi:Low temperature viability protein [Polychaeton citri CBS 116435]|uniref:Low temperature viability protein n=1 Tax=Polychaeton citri CBS 116435 TaxID=1314669 RepID=A0A9P4Q5F0_9PEZI|nr:Low temperature viability protein [Polychaeton citri CBS 116435]